VLPSRAALRIDPQESARIYPFRSLRRSLERALFTDHSRQAVSASRLVVRGSDYPGCRRSRLALGRPASASVALRRADLLRQAEEHITAHLDRRL
jgi:hypothetical protein